MRENRPRMMRRPVAALMAAALAVVLAVCAGCSTGNDAAVYGGSFTFVSPGGKTELSYPIAERKTVGTLSGPNLDGNGTVSVADYPDSVVVLNFWGSWCGPCRGEADDLNSAAGDLKAAGVQFVGINVKDSQSAGADFLASKQVGYPSIFDPTMRTLLSIRGYPATAIPSTIVLDRQHRVAHIWLNTVTTDQLTEAIAPIAAEK
jgi:thiol-disulfide isomerase/thioredoxin